MHFGVFTEPIKRVWSDVKKCNVMHVGGQNTVSVNVVKKTLKMKQMRRISRDNFPLLLRDVLTPKTPHSYDPDC